MRPAATQAGNRRGASLGTTVHAVRSMCHALAAPSLRRFRALVLPGSHPLRTHVRHSLQLQTAVSYATITRRHGPQLRE